MKRGFFPQARVLFTGILPRKKIPTDARLCNLSVEENIGFIPLSSDLQKAGGKTVRAKHFDGDGVHLTERGVANMLRSCVARIRQPATKAKDSFPQDKKLTPSPSNSVAEATELRQGPCGHL